MKEHFVKSGKMALGGIIPTAVGITMLARTVIFFFTGLLGVDVDVNKNDNHVMSFEMNK